MLYIKLKDLSDAGRLRTKVERRFPELALSTGTEFAEQEQMFAILEAVAMTISGLAVALGGIVMTNTQLMSVFERTREIGLLRSLGWRQRRVLVLILGESLALSFLGGTLGIGLGVATVFAVSRSSSWLGAFGTQFTPSIFGRALSTVIILGLAGGLYPAWRASRLLPIEALHYEGGGRATIPRFLPGFVSRNLWRQRTRTLLTLLSIGVSIAAIVALGALAEGMAYMMTQMWRSSQTDLFAIQAGVDSDISALDERIGARIAARSDVEAVSGAILTAINTKDMPMLIVFGYHPRGFAIRHFRIVKGEPLTSRHQAIVGRQAADQMGVKVGDTIRLLKSNFRVVGIYETGVSYEEIGVVIGLQEAQSLIGKPRQVMYFGIKLRDPKQAEAIKQELQADFPEADFALTAEIAESMSDFRVLEEMVGGISFFAVLIGGLGMLNTMLMSVLERTREIGVLRALGWRQWRVLWLILQESLVLGAIGGAAGILLGLALGRLTAQVPGTFGAIELVYGPTLFVQAIVVALAAGAVGGLYPAWRATRMRPVEALRYE
jgi:ABC-type antimicrobial peptide transport system permease subunit